MGRLFWKIFFAFWLGARGRGGAPAPRYGCSTTARGAADAELAQGPAAIARRRPRGRDAAPRRHRGAARMAEGIAPHAADPRSSRSTRRGATCSAAPFRLQRSPRARELVDQRQRDSPRAARDVAAGGRRGYLLFSRTHGEPRRRAAAAAAARALGARSSSASPPASPSARCSPGTWRGRSAACAGRSTPRPPGRLETRVAPRMRRRRDEIADLGRDFDRMAQQLQSLVSAQRRLLHDVSHELRSPLARLQAAIGLARQNPAEARGLARAHRARSDAPRRAGRRGADARAPGERHARARPKERVDLAYLAADIAEDARFEAEAARPRARASASRATAPVMRRRRPPASRGRERGPQRREVHARRHRGRSSNVHTAGARAVLTVSGPRARHHRRASSRKCSIRSIAARRQRRAGIRPGPRHRAARVDAHGGHIRAHNREGGGLIVKIELPLASSTSEKKGKVFRFLLLRRGCGDLAPAFLAFGDVRVVGLRRVAVVPVRRLRRRPLRRRRLRPGRRADCFLGRRIRHDVASAGRGAVIHVVGIVVGESPDPHRAVRGRQDRNHDPRPAASPPRRSGPPADTTRPSGTRSGRRGNSPPRFPAAARRPSSRARDSSGCGESDRRRPSAEYGSARGRTRGAAPGRRAAARSECEQEVCFMARRSSATRIARR